MGNITTICHIGNVTTPNNKTRRCFVIMVLRLFLWAVSAENGNFSERVKFHEKLGDFGIGGVPFKYWIMTIGGIPPN